MALSRTLARAGEAWRWLRAERWERRAWVAWRLELSASLMEQQRSALEAEAAHYGAEVIALLEGAAQSHLPKHSGESCVPAAKRCCICEFTCGLPIETANRVAHSLASLEASASLADALGRWAVEDRASAQTLWEAARREAEIARYRVERRTRGVRERYAWLAAQPLAVATRNERALFVTEEYFDSLRCVLPRRIADEELGDELELVARLLEQGRAPAWIYLKLVAVTAMVFINTARSLFGRSDR